MSTYFRFLEAVKSEDLSFLEDFLGQNDNEINLNDGDEDGVTGLHIAAGLQNSIILEYLLGHGSCIDNQTQEGLTPLHIAAMWGRSENVATLLNHGADGSLVDSNGCNALMHAINSEEDGSEACVQLILSHQENFNGYFSDQDGHLIRDKKPEDIKTSPKSELDFEKLSNSPWITPRRESKNSKRNLVKNEKTKCQVKRRLSTKFESSMSGEPYLTTDECTEENSETISSNPEGNFEELLTELSSGLLSSSGQDSSTDSNSLSFSYSTITCLDLQKLASLSNIDYSEYRTVHASNILTEYSTSDDGDRKKQGEKDAMKRDEFGNVDGNMHGVMRLQSKDELSDEDSCVYETADEEIEENLIKRKQNGNFVKDFKEERKKDTNAPKVINIQEIKEVKENRKDGGNIEAKCENGVGDDGHHSYRKTVDENEANEEINEENNTYTVQSCLRNLAKVRETNEEKIYKNGRKDFERESKKYRNGSKSECKQHEDVDVGKSEEQQPNNNNFEKKELFDINNDFDNLSIITPDDNKKPISGKDKHFNNSLNPKINQASLPFNSTFLVDSPLQHLSKQQSNFFIPIQKDKLVTKAKPSAENPHRNNCEETIIYDWREFSMDKRNETMAIVPAYYKKISCNELRKKIKDHGQIPGPITAQTRMLYVKKLWKLDQGIGKRDKKDVSPVSLYPVEIRLILAGKTEIPDCSVLEQEMIKEFCKSPRKVQWRGGTEKSSFNYLLLDPRVTLNLPQRSKKISLTEAFRCFVLSIFYVGKGKRSRPYAHLHEAIKYSKSKSNKKLDQIWEIWKDGLGVISLHLFQSAIPVEAFTREACMVEALGLSQLTNQKRGEYYGLCAKLELAKKRRLGIFFLYKAFQIFLQEGEREISREDL